jgi:hypothetical protein
METIDDIRCEDGNPRSQPVGGRPRSIFSFFSESTGPRLVAMLLIVVGLITLVAGSILFILPLMIAGLAVTIVSGLGYVWARPGPKTAS